MVFKSVEILLKQQIIVDRIIVVYGSSHLQHDIDIKKPQ